MNDWKDKQNLVTYIEDNSQQIRDFFEKTKKTFIEAIIIVLGVVILFLGSIRSSLTPILAIPISLIATFLPMKLMGCSLNVATLMAFLLSIGLVVDDAILVVENITKHYSYGKNLKQAALDGTEEIKMSVIVMTLTLACVFAPVIMAKGSFGSTLKEFALTLSFSVIISGIVSLTLTPSVCARMLSHSKLADKIFYPVEFGYKFLLKYALKLKYFFVFFTVFTIITSGMMLNSLPKENEPVVEQREVTLFSVNSGNRNLNFFKKNAREIVKFLKNHPDIENFSVYMSNSITLEIKLKKNGRHKNIINDEIMEFLSKNIKDISLKPYLVLNISIKFGFCSIVFF